MSVNMNMSQSYDVRFSGKTGRDFNKQSRVKRTGEGEEKGSKIGEAGNQILRVHVKDKNGVEHTLEFSVERTDGKFKFLDKGFGRNIKIKLVSLDNRKAAAADQDMINSLFKNVGKSGTLFTAHTHLGRRLKTNSFLRKIGKAFDLKEQEIKTNVRWEVVDDITIKSEKDGNNSNNAAPLTTSQNTLPTTPKETPGNTSVPGQRQDVSGSRGNWGREQYDFFGNKIYQEQQNIRSNTAGMLKGLQEVEAQIKNQEKS